MKERPVKRYPEIGCCGIDCGLCPRYHTDGPSRCPGCSGPGFFEVMSGCGNITCCVTKKGLEVCGECDEFPCKRFESWLDEAPSGVTDSFVTHRRTKPNLEFIRDAGLEPFVEQLRERMGLLETMLGGYNEGRSKSRYCLAAALLPIDGLRTALRDAEASVEAEGIPAGDLKARAKVLRGLLDELALREGVELKLGAKKGE